MRKLNNKVLGALACASALATVTVIANQNNSSMTTIVKADTTSISANSYGVDVASFQSTNLNADAQSGAQFAIVKVSEGTGYRNPNASGQIASAKANNIMPMAYHFATFSGNSNKAKNEANYAVSSAQAAGVPKGTYLACDWEPGDGNVLTGPTASNTAAISTFMGAVKNAGYQPMLYSSASFLQNHVNVSSITSQFPNSIWVAAYPNGNGAATNTANFNYFPSMDGVAIWQFTDNWRGMGVDGNITLIPLSMSGASQAPTTSKAATVVAAEMGSHVDSGSKIATVAYPGNIALWRTPNGAVTGRYLPNGSQWKVSGKAQVNGEWWYNLGGEQWIPGKYVAINGFSSIPSTSIAQAPASATSTSVTTNGPQVGRVNYVPGYGIMIWQNPGNGSLGRYLPHGSKWKVFKKTSTSDGKTWYNLGGNQWIDAQYLIVE